MPFKNKKDRLAYAKKYRKNHPPDLAMRRIYYYQAKARKEAGIYIDGRKKNAKIKMLL